MVMSGVAAPPMSCLRDLEGQGSFHAACEAAHRITAGASAVPRAANAGEDLAPLREVPVAEGGADYVSPRRPRAASQDPVAGAEEDLGVLAVRERAKAWVGGELARGPLPDVAEHLDGAAHRRRVRVRAGGGAAERELVEVRPVAVCAFRRGLPLRLGGQALARPAREGLGLLAIDVDHRKAGVELGGFAHRGPNPSARAIALPVEGPVAILLGGEGCELAIRHGRPIDPERRDLDDVQGTLVVVGEA